MQQPYLTFEGWIDAVFDHPVTEPAWYFSDEPDSALLMLESDQPDILLQYLTRTFEEICKLPERFSDGQIAAGLEYIINPAASGAVYTILDTRLNVEAEARIRCIDAMYTVYEQLFAVRCKPDASLNPANTDPLNAICYMWWDVLPAPVASEDNPSPIDEAMLKVMDQILNLDSEICQKAALHGLNEWKFLYRARVSEIVNTFIDQQPNISPGLKAQAQAAISDTTP